MWELHFWRIRFCWQSKLMTYSFGSHMQKKTLDLMDIECKQRQSVTFFLFTDKRSWVFYWSRGWKYSKMSFGIISVLLFFYWQCLTVFLIHPNLPGPPTVICMTELHVYVRCLPEITLHYTPLGEVACFSDKKCEKTKLSFESFIPVGLWLLLPLCVWRFSSTGNSKEAK